MSDIFLSYAKEDRERVSVLAEALEGLGWSVFWDRETPVGISWREHIEDELRQSRCVVVAWSSSSVKSEWVLEEADDGKSRKVLIPISLETGVSPPFGFRTLQSLDITAWDGSGSDRSFQRLLKGLIRHLGAVPAKAGAPTEKPSAKQAATRKKTARKRAVKKPRPAVSRPAATTEKGAPTWEEDEQLNPRVLIEDSLLEDRKRDSKLPPPQAADQERTAPELLLTKEEVQAVLCAKLPQEGLYVVPEIPQDKAENAEEATRLPSFEQIFGLIDCTAMGSAKDALIFGLAGIYYHNGVMALKPGHGQIPYLEFAERQFRKIGPFTLDFDRGQSLNVAGCNVPKPLFLEIFQEIGDLVAAKAGAPTEKG